MECVLKIIAFGVLVSVCVCGCGGGFSVVGIYCQCLLDIHLVKLFNVKLLGDYILKVVKVLKARLSRLMPDNHK